jgi:hypothetical protein
VRDHADRDPPEIKIHALVVSHEQNEERVECIEGQLKSVAAQLKNYGVVMSFATYPAFRITSLTLNDSFRQHPTCYPSNSLAQDPAQAWIHVLPNSCSRLKLLEDLSARAYHNDYYFVLNHDVIFDIERFALALKSYLELDQGHWTMLAFDTFDRSASDGFNFSAPEKDRIDGPLDLYTISSSWGYRGAHAWLVHSARIKQLWDHLRSIPTMPLDWYPKRSSQLHASFVSYQSGSVWQRRYAPLHQISTACGYEVSSGILDASKPRIVQPSRDPISSQAEAIILGMYNSGTNLFHKLFQTNIEKPLNIELCRNYSRLASCGRVWKHTHPKRLSEAISLRPDYGDFNQTIAVVLVRHPFALIHSLQTGENLDVHCGISRHCGEKNKLPTGNSSVDILQKCIYVPPTTDALLESQMGNERIELPICPIEGHQCWENVAEGWNSYMSGYLYNLTRLFKQVKIIRYEDLVEAPERTMGDLAQVGALDLGRWDWTPYEGPSNNLGGNRSDALQKLTEHNYGADFTEDELNVLCNQLDKHLMSRLGYHGCTPAFNDVKRVNVITRE